MRLLVWRESRFWFSFKYDTTAKLHLSLFPRTHLPPVFDCLQYAKTEW